MNTHTLHTRMSTIKHQNCSNPWDLNSGESYYYTRTWKGNTHAQEAKCFSLCKEHVLAYARATREWGASDTPEVLTDSAHSINTWDSFTRTTWAVCQHCGSTHTAWPQKTHRTVQQNFVCLHFMSTYTGVTSKYSSTLNVKQLPKSYNIHKMWWWMSSHVWPDK